MKNKALILILIVLILIGVAFVLVRQKAQAPASAPENQITTTTAGTVAPLTFSWRFQTKDSVDGLAPSTQVALFAGGNAYDAGAYAGSCSEIAAANLFKDEVSGVLCWFAGGGDEVGVFKEGVGYVLKHGTQDEGTAEAVGFRGDFKQIAVIK
jgi:hypothetical protein